jgi:hypothetical protein
VRDARPPRRDPAAPRERVRTADRPSAPSSVAPRDARPPRRDPAAPRERLRTATRPSAPSSVAPRERRALTMQRGGRIDRGGAPGAADICARALEVGAGDEASQQYTHPLHTYPARMHPATARVLIEALAHDAPRDAAVVDPFCGAGTTLVEARARGLRAVGIDLSPLAVLLARAKTWSVPQRRRFEVRDLGRQIAAATLDAAKAARRKGAPAPAHRRPSGFDPKARDARLARWYAPHVRRELEALGGALDELREHDAEAADLLTASLSSILYKVSSRASDTDGSWVERHIARGNPTRLFADRVELWADGLTELAHTPGPPPLVTEGDARELASLVAPRSAWAVITSPPYAGTYDYADQQRLRFDFLGLRHKRMDEAEVGSRRGFASDPRAAHARWRADLTAVLRGIATVLAPGRPAALVIGDSMAAGRAIDAIAELQACAGDAVRLVGWASQTRAKLGTDELRAFAGRDKFEHVVLLEAAR